MNEHVIVRSILIDSFRCLKDTTIILFLCLRQLPRLYCQVVQNVCHLFMFSGKSNVLRVILLRKIYIGIENTLNC